jgi:hypothetical protein
MNSINRASQESINKTSNCAETFLEFLEQRVIQILVTFNTSQAPHINKVEKEEEN